MFGPAKTLMNRLRFAHRFAFFGALFSAIIVVLLAMAASSEGQQIDAARAELSGATHLREVRKVLQAVQEHRGLSGVVKAGEAQAAGALAERAQAIDAAFKGESARLAGQPSQSRILADWEALAKEWQSLKALLPSASGADSFARHTAYLRLVLRHIRTTADASELALDPELNSFHLMNGAVYLLPPLSEWSGQLRARGAAAIARKSSDANEVAAAIALATQVRDALDMVAESHARFSGMPAERRAPIDAARDALVAAAGAAESELRSHLLDGQYRLSGREFFDVATRPVVAAFKLQDATLDALDAELAGRIARLQRTRAIEIGAVLAALAVIGWLSMGALLGLNESVGKVIAGGARYAAGDLQARVEVTSHDELKDIAESFNAMGSHLRELIDGVKSGATRLSAAAGELSVSSGQVSIATQRQNDSASSMAASVEQLTVSISQVKDHSRDALRISREAGTLSDEGSQAVGSTATEMEGIARSATEMTKIIENLGQQSGQISRIVQVIQEIAGQTNLLALNAAIEAARAGEQGRGFSVVADEVRKLAERTSHSTQEISQMVAAIQSGTEQAVQNVHAWGRRVTEGVSRAQTAGTCVSKLHDGAAQVVTSVNEITSALDEQAAASTQIAQSVERIAQMSEENSAAVASMADSARSLESLASELVAAVARFRVAPAA